MGADASRPDVSAGNHFAGARDAGAPGVTAGSPADLPPVVVLGGEANALSVIRDLGRLGVAVYAAGDGDVCTRYSRYCRWIDLPSGGDWEESCARFLLGPESDFLRGAVLLACSDGALRVLARHRYELVKRYRLDDSDPTAQMAMLDKLTTYRLASAAGVPTPAFWEVTTRDEVLALSPSLRFPLMVKPRLSHVYESRFGRKHVIVEDFAQLLSAYDAASEAGVDVLLMEWIPGPDDRLCSYFTYLDERSEPLLHFTKRVVRRYPTGMGAATYHVTDWIPDLVEVSNRLFKHVGLRGLANVEFKRDDRDGQYRLIECNARFVASNGLVSASGVNLAAFVYHRIVGRPVQPPRAYKVGLRLWDPVRDYWSFGELRRGGQITLGRWLRSVLHRQTFPFFSWRDPLPALGRLTKPLRKLLNSRRKC